MQENTCCHYNLTQQPPSIFHKQSWLQLDLKDFLTFGFWLAACHQSIRTHNLKLSSREEKTENMSKKDDAVMKPIEIVVNSPVCFSKTTTSSANPKCDPGENPFLLISAELKDFSF